MSCLGIKEHNSALYVLSVCRACGYNLLGTVPDVICEDYVEVVEGPDGIPEIIVRQTARDLPSGHQATQLMIGKKSERRRRRR